MSNISHEDIIEYFKTRNNRFTNSQGMAFGVDGVNEIWTQFSLYSHEHGPLAIDISTQADGPAEFIEEFRLKTIEDIDGLGYYNSWMRYLNGGAEIGVTPFELGGDHRIQN